MRTVEMNNYPLPPYGRLVVSMAKRPSEIFLYYGNESWPMGDWCEYRLRNDLGALLLPPDPNPQQYRWPVKGVEMLGIQCGEYPTDETQRLSFLLLKAGASVVRIAGNAPNFAVYRQRRAAA